jgi:hypothetical protein
MHVDEGALTKALFSAAHKETVVNNRIRGLWFFTSLMILLFLLIFSIAAAAGPASPAAEFHALPMPYVGPEVHLDESIVMPLYDPSVAYDSHNAEYMIVSVVNSVIDATVIGESGDAHWHFRVSQDNQTANNSPDVAYDPVHDRYLVVWSHDVQGNGVNWDIRGRFVDRMGPISNIGVLNIASSTTTEIDPRVVYATRHNTFLVTWRNYVPLRYVDISGRRVWIDGSGFPNSSGSDFTIQHGSENIFDYDVAYNPSRIEYLVAYDDNENVFGRLLSNNAQTVGGELVIAAWPGPENHTVVASCPGQDQYVVAWQGHNADYGIYARFVGGDGSINTVKPIADNVGDDLHPDIACDLSGQRYLIAWEEPYLVQGAGVVSGIGGRIIQPNVQTSPEFIIKQVTDKNERANPALAGGATTWLTAWEHEVPATLPSFYQIHIKRVSPYAQFQPVVTK